MGFPWSTPPVSCARRPAHERAAIRRITQLVELVFLPLRRRGAEVALPAVHVPAHDDRFTDVAPRFLASDSIRILVNVNGYRFAVNVYGLTVNASGRRTREPNAKPVGRFRRDRRRDERQPVSRQPPTPKVDPVARSAFVAKGLGPPKGDIRADAQCGGAGQTLGQPLHHRQAQAGGQRGEKRSRQAVAQQTSRFILSISEGSTTERAPHKAS